MKQKDEKKHLLQEGLRLQRTQIRLMIISGIISSLPFLLPQIKIFGKLLNKLSLQSELPTLTIQLIIVLILFVILTLIFSIKCIKKNRIINNPTTQEEITQEVIKPDFILTNRSREIIQEQSDIFLDMQTEIEQLSVHSIKPVSSIIKKKNDRGKETFDLTDKAIKIIIDKIDPQKRDEIEKAYDFFKNPYKELLSDDFRNKAYLIYNFTETEMTENIGDKTKAKTGKDLALFNLQTIIDLLK